MPFRKWFLQTRWPGASLASSPGAGATRWPSAHPALLARRLSVGVAFPALAALTSGCTIRRAINVPRPDLSPRHLSGGVVAVAHAENPLLLAYPHSVRPIGLSKIKPLTFRHDPPGVEEARLNLAIADWTRLGPVDAFEVEVDIEEPRVTRAAFAIGAPLGLGLGLAGALALGNAARESGDLSSNALGFGLAGGGLLGAALGALVAELVFSLTDSTTYRIVDPAELE